MSYNPKSLFSQIQKKEQEAANSGNVQQFANENILKPTKAGVLTVRLLWLPPIKGADRDYPMINSYVHEFWDKVNKKFGRVVCSTSQYMDGETKTGFDNCPVCREVSKFYKQGQQGSSSAQELYKSFRRTCRGYIPVYVINGLNADGEDISGQIKILQYGKQFKDFFNSSIFGIAAKSNNEETEPIKEEDIIGLDAFIYYNEETDSIETSGYDLIITTTTKPMNINGKSVQMPQYRLDFGRKIKSIDSIGGNDLTTKAGVEYFKGINEEIGFDRDFLIRSTEATRQEFVTNFIVKKENITEEDDSASDADEVVEQPTPKKAPKSTPKKVEEHEESMESNEDIDNIDVDQLLAGLEK